MGFISTDNAKRGDVVFYIKSALEPKLIQKDDKGRILMVQIKVQGEKIMLIQ